MGLYFPNVISSSVHVQSFQHLKMFLWLVGSNQDPNWVSNHKVTPCDRTRDSVGLRVTPSRCLVPCSVLLCVSCAGSFLCVPCLQTVVMNDCIIRGDLANVRVGRHCVVKSRSVIRPPFKKFSKGYVIELSRFSLRGLLLLV